MMQPKFEKNNRVRLTQKATDHGLFRQTARPVFGKVLNVRADGLIKVHLEGKNYPHQNYFHPDFWEKISEE